MNEPGNLEPTLDHLVYGTPDLEPGSIADRLAVAIGATRCEWAAEPEDGL